MGKSKVSLVDRMVEILRDSERALMGLKGHPYRKCVPNWFHASPSKEAIAIAESTGDPK